MPKQAVIDFPVIGVEEASQIAERVVKEFKGSITTSGLAQALGMAEKGGGFIQKTAALRTYGLLAGRGTLHASGLAQRVAHPQGNEERGLAKREAFLSVDLFKRLAERLGGTVPSEDRLSIFVEEMTRAPRMEVARRIGRLHRIYTEGAKYLSAEGGEALTSAPAISPAGVGSGEVDRGFVDLRTADIQIRVPLNKASLLLLRAAIDNLELALEDGSQLQGSEGAS